jgi:transposase
MRLRQWSKLRVTPLQLANALSAAPTMNPLHRRILKLFLQRLELVEQQMAALRLDIAASLDAHQQAVVRLAAVPGYGIDSAQQVIAEVGPQAATFDSPEQLASWVGVCPGREESAEVSRSNRTPKGNRAMRRVLNQVAHAAVKTRGSKFQLIYRRFLPRLGHNRAIWAIAHRLCRLTWKILRQGAAYIEYGELPNPKRLRARVAKFTRELRALGYHVVPPAPAPGSSV